MSSIRSRGDGNSHGTTVRMGLNGDESNSSPEPVPSYPRQRWSFASWSVTEGERYAVVREHAHGGLGRILEGSDRRLNRPVALKELIHSDCHEDEARFMREALITSQLQHPGIVPIYDVGRWPSGEPFIAMKMIAGRSLGDVMEERKTLEQRLALLPNVIAVADAMAYAHSKRVIHRDLNPSNILIGEFGETLVVDWGLVSDLSASNGSSLRKLNLVKSLASANSNSESSPTTGRTPPRVTVTGVVLGTAEYMPPEQAKGDQVDERADVYAIGAILYHLLAGQPPYTGDHAEDVLEKLLDKPPAPLGGHRPRLPAELITIVEKAMARKPEERYRSAKELAEELRRYQTGQLVVAHDYTLPGLILHRLKRYRLPATLFAAMAIVGMAMGVVAFRKGVQEKLKEAATNERVLVKARASLEADPTASIAWLKHYPIDGINWPTVRDLAIEAQNLGVARQVIKTGAWIASLSADGRFLAAPGLEHNVYIWDLSSRRIYKELLHSFQVVNARFSPDDKLVLFFEDANPTLFLWDVASGFVRELRGHKRPIMDSQFSPDGAFIASTDISGSIRTWQLATGKDRLLGQAPSTRTILAFPGSGSHFVTGGEDGRVQLWDPDTGKSRLLNKYGKAVTALVFAPSGKFVASAAADGTVEVWDVSAGAYRDLGRHHGAVKALAISPDETILASADESGDIKLWSLTTNEARDLRGHLDGVTKLEFLPTGDTLVSGGQDGTIVFWDTASGKTRKILRGHRVEVLDIKASRDGKTLVTSSYDKTTRIWTIPVDLGRILSGHHELVYDVAWSPSGKEFATASRDKTVRLWNADSGSFQVLRGHTDEVYRVAFSPDGTKLASAGFDGTARLWELGSRETTIVARHENAVWAVAFSPDSRLLASGGLDGAVRLWHLDTATSTTLGEHKGEVRSVAFSPDGKLLASASTDGTVRIWSLNGAGSRSLEGHAGAVYQVVFSPTGDRLASSGADTTIRIWNVASGGPRVLTGHRERVRSTVFSPDGGQLVSASEDRSIRIWDLSTGRSRVLTGHTGLINGAVLSPDGRLIASASVDHTVRLWDFASGSALNVFRHGNEVRRLAFSPDGKLLISGSNDRTARLWAVNSRIGLPGTPMGLHEWFEVSSTMDIDPNSD